MLVQNAHQSRVLQSAQQSTMNNLYGATVALKTQLTMTPHSSFTCLADLEADPVEVKVHVHVDVGCCMLHVAVVFVFMYRAWFLKT